jgi:hypothetical protein
MVRARCWSLRFNLDVLNAAIAALDGPEEQLEFFTGLVRGFNAGRVKPDCSDSMSVGFAIGEESRQQAEGWSMASSINGATRKSNKKHQEVDLEVNQEVDQSGTLTLNLKPTKELPPTPKAKKNSIPEDLLPRLESLVERWPDHFVKDGKKIPLPKMHTPEDLFDRMVKYNKGVGLALMICAGEKHLEAAAPIQSEWDFAPAPSGYSIAMCNFYGQKNRWKEFK